MNETLHKLEKLTHWIELAISEPHQDRARRITAALLLHYGEEKFVQKFEESCSAPYAPPLTTEIQCYDELDGIMRAVRGTFGSPMQVNNPLYTENVVAEVEGVITKLLRLMNNLYDMAHMVSNSLQRQRRATENAHADAITLKSAVDVAIDSLMLVYETSSKPMVLQYCTEYFEALHKAFKNAGYYNVETAYRPIEIMSGIRRLQDTSDELERIITTLTKPHAIDVAIQTAAITLLHQQ